MRTRKTFCTFAAYDSKQSEALSAHPSRRGAEGRTGIPWHFAARTGQGDRHILFSLQRDAERQAVAQSRTGHDDGSRPRRGCRPAASHAERIRHADGRAQRLVYGETQTYSPHCGHLLNK